jgi:hypothetical protein
MPETPIGKPIDTPEQAALREGYKILRTYSDGTVIARLGSTGYFIHKSPVSAANPVMIPLDERGSSAIGDLEDSPAEAASRAGMRVVNNDPMGLGEPMGDVIAVDDDGMLYMIERTGNGPFAVFLGFYDDAAMDHWLER